MLEIPEKVRPMVSDYKMNLLQLRASETCDFQDPEVAAVFDISRSIYERDYQRINTVYKNRNITSELGIVIGKGLTIENNPEREIYILAKGYFFAKVRKGIGYTLVFELA